MCNLKTLDTCIILSTPESNVHECTKTNGTVIKIARDY